MAANICVQHNCTDSTGFLYEMITEDIWNISHTPWLFSLIGSTMIGLTGIFPLLIIPIEEGANLKTGENSMGNGEHRSRIFKDSAGTLKILLSFAVGGLLGDVFLHLLPEAWENSSLKSGITLVGANSSEVWDPEQKHDDADDTNQHFGADQKLIIKMALLGPEAKSGELNVLQVEAMGLKGPIKTPIALLEIGKTAQIILDLSFPDPPVTFTLVSGSGPVHIVGHNLLGTHMEEFDDMDEEMEEENIDDDDDDKEPEDEEDEEDEPKKKNAKLSTAAKYKNQANKNKKK